MADQTDAIRAGSTQLTEDAAGRVREALGDGAPLAMYRRMALLRRFEERAGRAYQQSKIKGFCHLYIGQEAVAVGAMSALTERDYVVTAYREHGQALARGLEPNAVMAELFGKAPGSSGGMGGSMHIFDVERKFYGGWGIVGGHIPTAAGIAWAIKYREEDAVCLCFFGEGSIHQGAFHEAANMAALWDLPLIMIIENNGYGMGTAIDRASAITELAEKATSYGIAAETIDGQNVFGVWEALARAIERAKSAGGPTLLDVRTYRYRGHSMSDPGNYRTKDEVNEAKDRDPIDQLGAYLVDRGDATQEELDAIDKEMKEIAKGAEAFAEGADAPPLSALYEHAYVEWPWGHEGPALPDA